MSDQQNTYIHGHHDSVLRSHRWRTVRNSAAYLIPHLRPGQHMLDVGCGPGTITIDVVHAHQILQHLAESVAAMTWYPPQTGLDH